MYMMARKQENSGWASAVRVNSLIRCLWIFEYKHIKCDIQAESLSQTVDFKGDLLEAELLHSGVGHQVEEDLQGLSGFQGLLGQPEEHVFVQLLVHQQLLLTGLVQADAPNAQQGVLWQRFSPGSPTTPVTWTLTALPFQIGLMESVVELSLEGLTGEAVQEPVTRALPPAQWGHVGVKPGRRQIQLRQALGQVAFHAAGGFNFTDIPEGVQTDAGHLVLSLEVVPVAAGDVEKHLDRGVVGEDPGLDNEGPHLPVDRQLPGNIQRTSWLEQLLGEGLVPGVRPKAYVDGREVFCLENHKTLSSLQRVSGAGATAAPTAAAAAAAATATANRLSCDLDLS